MSVRKVTDFVDRHYLVSFKNEETGEYLPAISTRQKTESEAVKTAFAWLRDGIPGRLVDEIEMKDYCSFATLPADAAKRAFHRGMVDADVSSGHTKFSGGAAERQITPELAAAVFRVHWNDERARLANMLAMVTGMRAREIQGLRVQDLGKDCLYVRHSWNFIDGLKTTKNNECRTVEAPFPAIIQDLLNLARRNPHGANMDSYVFWAELSDGKPMKAEIFLRDLRAALVKTGMGKESAKAYTFHGWRHYFTAYMRERVNEKLLQSQTGHKTLAMLEHYSDHRKAGDRELIQTAQIAAFGGLIPSGANSMGGS